MLLDDRSLSLVLQNAKGMELAFKASVESALPEEREAAKMALRLVIPLRQQLETWASLRMLRKELPPQVDRVGA